MQRDNAEQTKFMVNSKGEEQLEDGDLIGVILDVFIRYFPSDRFIFFTHFFIYTWIV